MLLLASLAHADCPFRTALADAQQAWNSSDYVAFSVAAAALEGSLVCLTDTPVTTAEAGAVHQIMAQRAWLGVQEAKPGHNFGQVEQSLRTLARLAPAPAPPAPFNADESLVEAWATPAVISEACGADQRLRPTRVRVDGTLGHCLPDDGAALVQWQDDRAYYVRPDSVPKELRPATSWGWAAAGLGVATFGAIALAGAAETRNTYLQTEDPALSADLDGQNLALGVGGYVLLGTAAGLGTVAIVQGRW